MTIDDELILELIKPNKLGEVGEGALIVRVVGTKKVDYELEETTYHWRDYFHEGVKRQSEMIPMTPDIMTKIFSPEEHGIKTVAIELENDLQWDFGESLRQLRKYKLNFKDTRVIIPKDFERFAPLYKKAGFRVFLWQAKRRWQCLKCGTETLKEGPVIPVCSNKKCGSHSQNEFRLVGVDEAKIEEF